MSQSAAINHLLMVLKRKSGGTAPPWNEKEDPAYYAGHTEAWSEDLIEAVACHVERHVSPWRPDVAGLYTIAADIASPMPAESALRQELRWRAFHRGATSAEPIFNNERLVYRVVPPPPVTWSHPLLALLVAELDGMEAVYALFADTSSQGDRYFTRRFHEAYVRCGAEWRHYIIDELGKPEEARHPEYFRHYEAWTEPDRAEQVMALSSYQPNKKFVEDLARQFGGTRP